METPRATTEMCFYETYQVVALKRGRRSSRYASAHPLDRVAVPHARERVPGPGRSPWKQSSQRKGRRGCADAEADMPLAEAAGARCVQNFDGSHTAIHTTYRISLRSSSIREPRYPLLRVVLVRSARRATTRNRRFSGWLDVGWIRAVRACFSLKHKEKQAQHTPKLIQHMQCSV